MFGFVGIDVIVGFLLAWLIQQIRFAAKFESIKIESARKKKDIEADQQ
jgi:hypothetical protein